MAEEKKVAALQVLQTKLDQGKYDFLFETFVTKAEIEARWELVLLRLERIADQMENGNGNKNADR
jgi:hypothetical protein